MNSNHTPAAVPALTQGCQIRIVAPAGVIDGAAFEAGVARLRERYEVVFDEGILSRKGYLAGPDERRAQALLDALNDPDARAIIAARGGYGCTRVLSRICARQIRRANKLLVGFSDITALHAQWFRAGIRSVHGSMVCALGGADAAPFDRWCKHLHGAPPAAIEGLCSLGGGCADGPTLGGNLAVLCALLATPFAPDPSGTILLLEDVGERPYRVDRMLTSLRQAGWFERAAGVLLGEFTDCEPGPDGVTVEDVIRDRLGDLPIPVAFRAPFGHGPNNVALPIGAPARLDASAGNITFYEGAVYNS